MNRTIRMALTKGRIEKDAVSLLEAAGYGCAGLRNKGRRLIVPTDGGEIDVVFAKAADVITYVETGACDIGIVGKDTILENGSSFYEMADLGIGRCRMVLAAHRAATFSRATRRAGWQANIRRSPPIIFPASRWTSESSRSKGRSSWGRCSG